MAVTAKAHSLRQPSQFIIYFCICIRRSKIQTITELKPMFGVTASAVVVVVVCAIFIVVIIILLTCSVHLPACLFAHSFACLFVSMFVCSFISSPFDHTNPNITTLRQHRSKFKLILTFSMLYSTIQMKEALHCKGARARVLLILLQCAYRHHAHHTSTSGAFTITNIVCTNRVYILAHTQWSVDVHCTILYVYVCYYLLLLYVVRANAERT